ncbi:DUF4180 domain-containing protein [Micromonospora sp. URMC 106]|uniref:DUF4180 domain-containing protein n=1 Tax=Micromonospora sp. URMC 106 TaxID=3423408 RepID=UPI003F1CE68C
MHVRTVRGYIRAGRLRAVRIGKQYRIARTDLDALTGRAEPARPAAGPAVEVSSIVQIDGVDRAAADRLDTLVLAGANTSHDPGHPLRVQTVHDEFVNFRLRLVVVGDISRHLAASAALRALVQESNQADHVWFVPGLDALDARLRAATRVTGPTPS